MRARIHFGPGARHSAKSLTYEETVSGKWWNMWGECEGKDGACEGWWWVSNDSLSRVRLGDTRRGEARRGDGFDYGSRSWLRRRRARGNARCEAPGDGSQAFVIANVRLGLGGRTSCLFRSDIIHDPLIMENMVNVLTTNYFSVLTISTLMPKLICHTGFSSSPNFFRWK